MVGTKGLSNILAFPYMAMATTIAEHPREKRQKTDHYNAKLGFKKNFVRNGVTDKAMLQRLLAIVDQLYELYTAEQMFHQCMQYFHNPYVPHGEDNHLYQKHDLDQWITVNAMRVLPGFSNRIYNSSDNDEIQDLNFNFHQPPNHKLLFHVTNWRSFKNIVYNGIDLAKSARCQDFGQRGRFYLSDSMATAVDFAAKIKVRCEAEVCVMVFVIPIVTFQSCKRFTGPSEEWQKLVTYSRQCVDHENSDEENAACIYGPMCANPKEVIKGMQPIMHRRSRKRQLAANQRGLASLSHIGTLFLNKNVLKTQIGGFESDEIEGDFFKPSEYSFTEMHTFFAKAGFALSPEQYNPANFRGDLFEKDYFLDIVSNRFGRLQRQRLMRTKMSFPAKLTAIGASEPKVNALMVFVENDKRLNGMLKRRFHNAMFFHESVQRLLWQPLNTNTGPTAPRSAERTCGRPRA